MRQIAKRYRTGSPAEPRAGLTQHGVPLHDAIKAMPFPVLEIHMSNIAYRESWRALDHLAGGDGHDPGAGVALIHSGPACAGVDPCAAL